MKRWYFCLCIGLSVILAGSCESGSNEPRELTDFIPVGSNTILKISDLESLRSDVANSSVVGKPETTLPFQFFSEETKIFQYLQPNSESLLCLTQAEANQVSYAFITRVSEGLFVTDSIPNRIIETLPVGTHSIQRVTLDDQITFTAEIDSVFIASPSQPLIEDLLKGRVQKDTTFSKIYNILSANELTVLLKGNNIGSHENSNDFSSWTALSTQVLPDGVVSSGVSLAKDTIPQVLNAFKGQIPQQNDLPKLIPTTAQHAVSITYSDPELLNTSLSGLPNSKRRDSILNPLFESTNEAGIISEASGQVLILKSIDASLTQDAFGGITAESSSFRETTVFSVDSTGLSSETFAPLLPSMKPKWACMLDNFFVFSENENALQSVIAAYKNNKVLSNSPGYQESANLLSNASSLTYYELDAAVGEPITHFYAPQFREENGSSKSPLAVLQYIYDRNFAHVNLVSKEVSASSNSSGSVAEVFSLELENTLMSAPQFFFNHRTKGRDIVVQDVANNLHFLSSGGKILWTKSLKGPILGEIQEVDLLRNGRKQLAFSTKNALHVVDRNGKDVSPFPINFRDEVTQPLSVFDYDNNRKYRFVIVQGKDILMYDSKAKIVSGFKFTKADSEVTLPPQHIRMNSKDYILIAEDDGSLNILSRVGKTRVPVAKKFEFTDIPIAKEGNSFVVITKSGTKESISQSGKISSQPLNVSDNYWFTVKGTTKATMDDNLLRINGKLADLPYGIYSSPAITIENRETFITVTENQEKKVYLFDRLGNLQPGFPIYGQGMADVSIVSQGSKRFLVVQGANKEVILYSF